MSFFFFFFQAEDGIRDWSVTGVQTCALPICTLANPRIAIRKRADVSFVLPSQITLVSLRLILGNALFLPRPATQEWWEDRGEGHPTSSSPRGIGTASAGGCSGSHPGCRRGRHLAARNGNS